MAKFNYSKQFPKKDVNTAAPVEAKNEEIVQEEQPTVTETVVEELPAPVNPPKMGVVTGCEKLRVRKGPSKQTNPATIINKGCEVTILEELAEWYKVGIADGMIGYCMSEFITIK